MPAAACALALLGPGAAGAHVTPDVVITSPAQGSLVTDEVDIVLVAEGFGMAVMTLGLDGQPVGGDGSVGAQAAFTSLSMQAGERRVVSLRGLRDGVHTLVLRQRADQDNAKADVVRSFTVQAGDRGLGELGKGALVAAVFLLLLAASVVIRRRGLRQR